MNEWRQARGAAAAGASTSSPGGVAEQIAAQQHPAPHPAALSINNKTPRMKKAIVLFMMTKMK